MALFNQWHIEEIELDADSNTQGAIPVIYGRQGDKDGILCNITLLQQGVPATHNWFRNKRVFYEARGNGVSVRKQADRIVNGIVKVVIPEAAFKNIGLVPENFIRVEDASTGATVISATSSFKLYVRAGSLDPGASKYYLEEIERIALNFNRWIDTIKGTLDKDPALSLANSIATLRDYVDAKGLETIQARGTYESLEKRLNAIEADTEGALQFAKDRFFANGKALALSELPVTGNGEVSYNGVSFIQDNLTTFNGHQYATWINKDRKVVVGKRKLGSNKWELHSGATMQNYFGITAKNEHKVYCIAVDSAGYIHISGNQHASVFKYMRSARPYDISSWVQGNMTGSETSVTYPRFLKTKEGDLLFLYRTGGSYVGNTVLNRYSTGSKTWSIEASPLINGAISNENPYLNRVVCDEAGVIHISGCFRGTQGAKSNNDIFYMKSEDGGVTWKKSNGTRYTLPVTHATAELVVDTAPLNSGLINQNGMDIDASGTPHIAYFRTDSKGFTNIFHAYKSGVKWIEVQVTSFNQLVDLDVEGWAKNLSRPSLFCYGERTFIIYTTSFEKMDNLIKLQEVTPGKEGEPVSLMNMPMGTWEPTFDSEAMKMGVLSMLVSPSGTGGIWDNWYNQYAGVLSIDLLQIDKILRAEVPIPSFKWMRGLQSVGAPFIIKQASGAVPLEGQPELIIADQNRTIFARLVMRAYSRKEAKFTLKINHIDVNTSTPVYTTFNSLAIQLQNASSNTKTPWQPIPQKEGSSLLSVEATIELLGGTVSDVNLSGYAIEVAYLE